MQDSIKTKLQYNIMNLPWSHVLFYKDTSNERSDIASSSPIALY